MAAQFISYERPNAWLNSGGAGTMGYAVPAAMGAKVSQPDRVVWAIDGDGCFQMTNQELATCAINNIPIKVAVINNSSLGMVRQWQTLFYDGRYSHTELNTGHDSVRIPDFVKLADAYGCLAIRVERPEDVDAAIRTALETNDRPVVIDFVVSADAMVWRWSRRASATATSSTRATTRRPSRGSETMASHVLSLLVEDKPGLLTRVAGLFARRGFNIESLAVGVTEVPGLSRITVVVDVDELPLEQVTKQLNKLINVIKIVELEPAASVQREHMLIKVRADNQSRSHILEVVSLFRAQVVDYAPDALVVEVTGDSGKVDALLRALEPFGIKELAQSGLLAIGRGGKSITERVLRS